MSHTGENKSRKKLAQRVPSHLANIHSSSLLDKCARAREVAISFVIRGDGKVFIVCSARRGPQLAVSSAVVW